MYGSEGSAQLQVHSAMQRRPEEESRRVLEAVARTGVPGLGFTRRRANRVSRVPSEGSLGQEAKAQGRRRRVGGVSPHSGGRGTAGRSEPPGEREINWRTRPPHNGLWPGPGRWLEDQTGKQDQLFQGERSPWPGWEGALGSTNCSTGLDQFCSHESGLSLFSLCLASFFPPGK